VRLTLEDGTEFEDDADGNLALFIAEHDAAPRERDGLRHGQQLTTHHL
jgi:hypothetical protein